MIKETKELSDLVVKNKEEKGPWFSDPITQAVIDIGRSGKPVSMTVYAQTNQSTYAFYSDNFVDKDSIYAVLTINSNINLDHNLKIINSVKKYFQDRIGINFYNDAE